MSDDDKASVIFNILWNSDQYTSDECVDMLTAILTEAKAESEAA